MKDHVHFCTLNISNDVKKKYKGIMFNLHSNLNPYWKWYQNGKLNFETLSM